MNIASFGRIGVLMGGMSAERAISLKSGAAVLAALQSMDLKLDVVGIDLSAQNSSQWADQIQQANIQTAFIALHGTHGEDGCIQGLLETMAIPYTGSGVTASALCMHKLRCKQILEHAGLKTPIAIQLGEHGPERYPAFIKPISEGSSIGLHYLRSESDWQALQLDTKQTDINQTDIKKLETNQTWMAEIPVHGVEIAVSVLQGSALMPVEVAPHSGVYDYASKYTAGATAYFCPARLPAETLRYCMQQAEQAVRAAGCSGAPRVDMIVDSGGDALILEINTIPGMTETSLLPKAAAAAGIDFTTLCWRLIESATLEHAVIEHATTKHVLTEQPSSPQHQGGVA